MTTFIPPRSGVTPVVGYREQSPETLARVNENKLSEEALLQRLEADVTANQRPDFDRRWTSIARTHLEQAFMAWNRALMSPQRAPGVFSLSVNIHPGESPEPPKS